MNPWLAAESGDLAAVRQVVEEEGGVDVNAQETFTFGRGIMRGRTVLMAAVESGNLELVEYLLDKGADPNILGRGRNHITMQWDVNTSGTVEESALHVAVKLADLAVVARLVEADARLNIKDSDGRTPLVAVIWHRSVELVEYLLWRGSDVNTTDLDMLNPLMISAIGGAEEIVEQLLKAGANVNAVGHVRFTALMFAARSGHCGVAELLVEAGADVTVVDKNGKSALDWAEEHGHNVVAAFLRSVWTPIDDVSGNCVRVNEVEVKPAGSSRCRLG